MPLDNNFTGLENDILSNSVLEGFLSTLAPLLAFSTNFNGDAVKRGAKIDVLRISGQASEVQTKTTANEYVINDSDADMVEIALNRHKYESAGLHDIEVANSSVLDLEKFGRSKGHKLALQVVQDVLGHVTEARFGAAVFTGAASGFDSDDVIDIRTACGAANMPKQDRSLIIDDAYVGSLLKDTSVKNSDAFGGSNPVREGVIGRLAGFDIVESAVIPDNEENLVGIAAHPSGLAMAMRYLAPQDGHTYSDAYAITDPTTGIVIGVRDGYDQKGGYKFRIWECLYGFELGIADAIKRLISAEVVDPD